MKNDYSAGSREGKILKRAAAANRAIQKSVTREMNKVLMFEDNNAPIRKILSQLIQNDSDEPILLGLVTSGMNI